MNGNSVQMKVIELFLKPTKLFHLPLYLICYFFQLMAAVAGFATWTVLNKEMTCFIAQAHSPNRYQTQYFLVINLSILHSFVELFFIYPKFYQRTLRLFLIGVQINVGF